MTSDVFNIRNRPHTSWGPCFNTEISYVAVSVYKAFTYQEVRVLTDCETSRQLSPDFVGQ